MKGLTCYVYTNSVIYFLIVFILPFLLVKDCGEGLDPMCHMIYGFYSIVNLIGELCNVCAIKKSINNDDILKLNAWHFVELAFG